MGAQIYDLGIIDEQEYAARKKQLVDEITGVQYPYHVYLFFPLSSFSFSPSFSLFHSLLLLSIYTPSLGNGTVYSPQLKFLLNRFVCYWLVSIVD
jgi:hypothetical protein